MIPISFLPRLKRCLQKQNKKGLDHESRRCHSCELHVRDKTYLAPRCEELALPGRPSVLPSGSLLIVEYIDMLASTSVKQRNSERPSYDHEEELVGGRNSFSRRFRIDVSYEQTRIQFPGEIFYLIYLTISDISLPHLIIKIICNDRRDRHINPSNTCKETYQSGRPLILQVICHHMEKAFAIRKPSSYRHHELT